MQWKLTLSIRICLSSLNIKHSPHRLGWGGGQDKNAQKKAAGARWFRDFVFAKMLVELSQMLEVWKEKCVSGVIFWRAWGSKKRGFDCIFTVFSCFPPQSYFFRIKHAKCDLTVKNKWKMRLGWILARAAFCQNWVLPCNLHGFKRLLFFKIGVTLVS